MIIPVYNEAKNIRKCINQVREFWPRIIVVNDGSNDKTGEILNEIKDIEVVELPQNLGKGAAMAAGAKKAWKLGAKAIIFMDGDNQHNPKHIAEFVRVLKRGYDLVIGIRLLRTDIPWHRKLGNNIMAKLMRALFGIEIPDMMCGFRAMTKRGFNSLKYVSRRYGVEVEMLALIGRRGLAFQTLIVDTIYHDKYKGFSVRDGLKIMVSLPYYRWHKI